jgi:hypothetical protein
MPDRGDAVDAWRGKQLMGVGGKLLKAALIMRGLGRFAKAVAARMRPAVSLKFPASLLPPPWRPAQKPLGRNIGTLPIQSFLTGSRIDLAQ